MDNSLFIYYSFVKTNRLSIAIEFPTSTVNKEF